MYFFAICFCVILNANMLEISTKLYFIIFFVSVCLPQLMEFANVSLVYENTFRTIFEGHDVHCMFRETV